MLVAFACLAEEHPPGAPTYYGDAGRILSRHCVGCHREGQLGRIPLDTWRQARLFAKEIRLVVGMRMMPPWPAVPEFGHFSNDRSLSIADVETLIRWTDTGAQKGTGEGNLVPTVIDQHGRDRALEIGYPTPYRVPATGDVESRCFAIPAPVTRDTWIRGIDVIPGDPRVVLHVRVLTDPESRAEALDRADSEAGFNCARESPYSKRLSLGDWAPAMPLQLLPPDLGRVLPTGTPLLIEIRYARIGSVVEDKTRVRLLTLDKRPAQIVQTRFISSDNLAIPADTWDFRAEATWTADQPITLISLIPYMSSLGSDFKATLFRRDGTREPLVWVHDYRDNQQIAYILAVPVAIAPGDRVRVEGEFDNFETNPKSTKGKSARGQFALALEYVLMAKAAPPP
jgi:hypothetical protein